LEFIVSFSGIFDLWSTKKTFWSTDDFSVCNASEFHKIFFTIDAARLVGYLLLEFIKSGRLRVLQ
ncbi:MAG: hypothetical protein WCI45_11280, partial [Desulfuromonadales bacterium]